MPVYSNHIPAGTSMANIVQYGQNVKSKNFEMLDYMNEDTNWRCYGNARPARVPIENFDLKDLYLLNGLNDLLADPDDVETLKQNLRGI